MLPGLSFRKAYSRWYSNHKLHGHPILSRREQSATVLPSQNAKEPSRLIGMEKVSPCDGAEAPREYPMYAGDTYAYLHGRHFLEAYSLVQPKSDRPSAASHSNILVFFPHILNQCESSVGPSKRSSSYSTPVAWSQSKQ